MKVMKTVTGSFCSLPGPVLGKTEGRRRRKQQRMRWLESTTNSMDVNLSNSGEQ